MGHAANPTLNHLKEGGRAVGTKNPYAGQPEEASYDQGFRDGFAEPEVSHPIPPEFADNDILQDAYLRGEIDGKADVQAPVDGGEPNSQVTPVDPETPTGEESADPNTETFWLQVDEPRESLQEVPMSQVKDGQPAFSFKLEADPLCIYEDSTVQVTLKVSGTVTVSFASSTTCTVDMTSLPFSTNDPNALGQFNDCAGWVLGQAKVGASKLFASPTMAVQPDRTLKIGGSLSSELASASMNFSAPATWVITGSIAPFAAVSTGAGPGKASAALSVTITITGREPLPEAQEEASLWPLVVLLALGAPVVMTAAEGSAVVIVEGTELAGAAAKAFGALTADTSTVLIQRLIL